MSSADNNINTKLEDKNQDRPVAGQEESLKELEEMYKAGVHFGYSGSMSNPKMKPYFFVSKNNMEVFNLLKIQEALKCAEDFMKDLGSRDAKFLLVSTKPEAKEFIEKIGEELKIPYVTERWIGGILTNFNIIKKRIDYLNDFRAKRSSGSFSEYTKKEISRLDKKLAKLEKYFGGIQLLDKIPEVVLVIDSRKENATVVEARKTNVKIVAIMNSDCDPEVVDYPIPANDVASSSVQYLLNRLILAYKEGLKHPKETPTLAEGEVGVPTAKHVGNN